MRLSHLSLKCPEEQVNISDAWFLAIDRLLSHKLNTIVGLRVACFKKR